MTREPLIAAKRQRSWKWPAALYFILGGTGAGGYLFCYIVQNPANNSSLNDTANLIYMSFILPSLVIFSFLALALEAGKPLRSLILLRGIRKSWVSREIMAFFVFIITAVMAGLFPGHHFQIVAMFAAFCLLICQGFVVYASLGIPAWNTFLIPPLFLTSGLVSGAGLTMIFWSISNILPAKDKFIIAILFMIINASIWLLYLKSLKGWKFQSATRPFNSFFNVVLVVGFGHLLPIFLLTFSLINTVNAGPWKESHLIISGTLMLVSTAWQKINIILLNGYHQEITIKY